MIVFYLKATPTYMHIHHRNKRKKKTTLKFRCHQNHWILVVYRLVI